MANHLVFFLTFLFTLSSTVSAITSLGYVIVDSSLEDFSSLINDSYINSTVDNVVNVVPGWTKSGQEVTAKNVIYYNGSTTPVNRPLMSVAATIMEIDDNEVEIFMFIQNVGAFDTNFVTLQAVLYEGLEIQYNTLDYISLDLLNPTTSDITDIDGKRQFTWSVGSVASNASKNASFKAFHDRKNMADINRYNFELSYYQTTSNTSDLYGPIIAKVCIERSITYKDSIFYQHGFTALSFFMGLILGVLLVVLGFFIYFLIRRKKTVSPTKANQEKMLMERGKTIMMSDTDAMKKGGHTINDYSLVGEGDSIVGVLGMKDKMQMHREIDSLDIVNTVNVDTDIEKERNDASMATTELLISGLHSNNDISRGTQDAVLGNMRTRRSHLDRQQDEDYKREMKKLYQKISAKNRAMMNSMMQKQRNEKKELVSATQDLPTKERNDVLNLMNEQHLSEQNAETYKLKLEQDEETEKLRKEFAIRGRMGLKEIQLQALTDVQDQGKLSDQQVKWLIDEHQKTQKALESMYDDEISRQRMALEEKLARRKALAQAAETQEEDNDYLLNTVASQQVLTIEKLKKNKSLTAAEANEMIDEAKKNMIAIKDKMEKERAQKEAVLHKRLSELKQKRLKDMEKEHQLEKQEYERKCKAMQSDGPIDPMAYADGRLKLLSQQRVERNNVENEIDLEHTNELTKLRDDTTTQTEQELRGIEKSVQEKVSQDGDTQELIAKLLRDHENEKEALRASQQRNRDKQMRALQDRLEKNREDWAKQKEAEKAEQAQLREYEDQVVNKLVNSQVSMSEDERDRILKEHEKHMVTLENSLTLNKLRQKRMMEEKLAQRRAVQMEKLQLKQYKEKEVQRRQRENNGEDSDDVDSQKQKVELMKEHVEQKMAIMHGRKLDWDTELETIRVEMLKERSLALKEQEERLGALVAGLQIDKAKELAKIEEQQRAIHNLKTNLIDDLNARGVLSDPETQAVIRRHQEEQDALRQRLDDQRSRQEQMLKEKLQQRLVQREKSMLQAQDEELKNLVAPNKTAAKIKKMLMIHNHMVAMEKMRNQLEREISQTLEQVKYEYDVCKKKAVQDQEMEFIAGLVRVGTIPQTELESVLRMLYPGKSEKEFAEIFNKLFDPALQPRTESRAQAELSHLTSRVAHDHQFPPPILSRRSSIASELGVLSASKNGSLRKSKKKKPSYVSPQDQQQYYQNDQFEDNSRFRPSSRQSFDESDSRFNLSGRQSLNNTSNFPRQPYEDHPHPLEAGYSTFGQKQNGRAYANPIMEEDDDVVSAQYVSNGYNPQPAPRNLPPLQEKGGRKKKKKKFLKKLASPRAYEDDDDLL